MHAFVSNVDGSLSLQRVTVCAQQESVIFHVTCCSNCGLATNVRDHTHGLRLPFCRVAESGLPAILATNPRAHGPTNAHYELDWWLRYGNSFIGAASLASILEPIITAHQEKTARDDRERLLNDRCRGLGWAGA